MAERDSAKIRVRRIEIRRRRGGAEQIRGGRVCERGVACHIESTCDGHVACTVYRSGRRTAEVGLVEHGNTSRGRLRERCESRDAERGGGCGGAGGRERPHARGLREQIGRARGGAEEIR